MRLLLTRVALLLVGLGWLALAHPQAQTAPVIQWTHSGTNVTHFQIVIGTAETWVVDAGLPTPSGTTYEYALPALPAGTWQIKVRACYGADCQDSAAMTVVKMVPAGATALNYYWVSPTGAAASWAACKSDTPLSGASACTLAQANAGALAGDTVWLRSGATPYAESISPTNSGSAESRITFAGHPNETPTFTVTDDVLRYAVRLSGDDYVTVRGIASEGSYAFFFIAYGSDYNEIAYSTFNNSQGMYSLGIIQGHNSSNTDMAPSTHNWLHHNTFSRYGKITDPPVYSDSGTVRIQSGDGDTSNHNTVEQNVLFYGGHDAFDVGGTFNVIRNNVFHNEEAYFPYVPSGSPPNNTPSSGYFGNRNLILTNYGEDVATAFHTLVEGNRSGHSGMAPDDDGSFGIENAGVHSLIRYNAIYNTAGAGIYFKQQAAIYLSGLTGNAGTDVLTRSAHGQVNGDVVYIYTKVGGTGLSTNVAYFVINKTTDTFQVALTTGGDAVDFSTDVTSGILTFAYEVAVTAEADDDTFTAAAHGFYPDMPVRFAELTGGDGLTRDTLYYVVAATANTFKLSETIRGAVVNVTSDLSAATLAHSRIRKSGNWGKVYHNTVYHAGFGDADISAAYKYGVKVIETSYTPARPWPVGVVVRENIVYDSSSGEADYDVMPDTDVTYTNNLATDPSFVDATISNAASLTLPTLRLGAASAAIGAALRLTQANGLGSSSTTLVVDDAMFFQDGSWGSSLSAVVGDVIAVGTVGNTAQVSAVDYQTNTITLASALTWADNADVWVVRDSWGVTRLVGDAPDQGAYDYGLGASVAPTGVVVR